MMTDLHSRHERRYLRDPEDPSAFLAALTARARIEGPAAFLVCLDDRRLWQACPAPIQDQAIAAAATVLGEAFEHRDTRLYACGGQAHRIAGFAHRASGLVFQLLPGGAFTMGARRGPREEKPAHPATIRRPFLLGRTPVTQGQWRSITGKGIRAHSDRARHENFFPRVLYHGVGADRPMYYVTWHEADAAARRLGLRLPGEAEWEYACRAGTDSAYFWGESWDERYCWAHKNSGEACRPVTAHAEAANAFGLVDMAGNVYELCADRYVAQYRSGPEDERPRFHGRSHKRVIRGGSALNSARSARSAHRFGVPAHGRAMNTGLRLACSLTA